MNEIKLRGLKPTRRIAMPPHGLFIGTSKLLLALMNTAPAELLHHLMHAALQPHPVAPLLLLVTTTLAMTEGLKSRAPCAPRRPQPEKTPAQCRRRNKVYEKPTRFSKKKPPRPTASS
ncbi:MAG TPA: hypothetical protein VM406_10645 [Noviherbaspirillum sp.]|nr:hypothetical protein [Noviherbaspirillum sp.]